MTALDSTNEAFGLAVEMVNQSNRNIFLTGKAGTGKTTFLRYIKAHSLKEAAIVAPTGVAAINAGGTTIHSFFQVPFTPFLPDGFMGGEESTNKHTLLGKIKLNRDRIKVLQQLELLIIDEISMVRCDVLDAIDTVLRHFRHRHAEPFGGVQVLLIGDMYQLPPVAIDAEWSLLSRAYDSPYFFDSHVMRQAPPAYIEFDKIYRQRDDRFVELLNQVRHNALTDEGRQILQSLYKPGFAGGKEDGYIILTTHNAKADAINNQELSKLKQKTVSFKAEIKGDFSDKAYPADETLQLKEGARVMFIRNDKEKVRRYFNGKIGVVVRISDNGIFVQCNDQPEEIEVQKETWDNIRYNVNKGNNQVEENVIGSFSQFPLRLAWAITIHKSQGLTFEKAIIDAGAAFAPGQVYVALSRCTALEGIVLHSHVTGASLKTDPRIAQFSQRCSSSKLKDELSQSKREYQQQILLNLFDLSQLSRATRVLTKLARENTKDFNDATLPWLENLEVKVAAPESIGLKFKAHLEQFFSEPVAPEENVALQKRVKEASEYFVKELDAVLQLIGSSPAVTDSKLQAKAYNDGLKDVFTFAAEKKHLFHGFVNGFTIETYYKQRKSFVLPSIQVNSYSTATSGALASEQQHPELHYRLRQLRNTICEQKNLPVFMVAATKSIDEMTQFLPQRKEELVMISGFGRAKVNNYGEQFLSIINEYCAEHGLASNVDQIPSKKERTPRSERKEKVDTKALSYDLYKKGNTIAEVAATRNLAVTTVEGHLASYVAKGLIPVQEFIEAEKLGIIEPALENYDGGPITPIMAQLENKVSFSEIRFALAAKEWEKLQTA